MRTASGSRRWVTNLPCPGRRLSSHTWMSSACSGMPGGQPSTTQPIAGPWLSPQVVTRNKWPNVLWDMGLFVELFRDPKDALYAIDVADGNLYVGSLVKTRARIDWLALYEYAAHSVDWRIGAPLAHLMNVLDNGAIEVAMKQVGRVLGQRALGGGVDAQQAFVGVSNNVDACCRCEIEAESRIDHRA